MTIDRTALPVPILLVLLAFFVVATLPLRGHEFPGDPDRAELIRQQSPVSALRSRCYEPRLLAWARMSQTVGLRTGSANPFGDSAGCLNQFLHD